MRKLIIIGNGFDLAHGLNTSYKSFLFYYLHSVREKLLKQLHYDDTFLIIENTFGIDRLGNNVDNIALHKWFTLESIKRSNGSFGQRFEFKSSFFKKLIFKLESNWVDIENEYFQSIIEAKDDEKVLTAINNELAYLKKCLIDYLKKEEQKNLNTDLSKFTDIFENNNSGKNLFLNFNYTNTIERYIYKLGLDASLIYIHGDLHEQQGEPIFGIGDEHHEDYISLKNHKNLTQALKYSKSILYLRNGNRDRLIEYIEKAIPFEVEIIGHSCGLSDRTLLKVIFQHRNCNKIRIYHYDGIDEYSKKTIEVLRHFDDPHMFQNTVERFYPAFSMRINDDI